MERHLMNGRTIARVVLVLVLVTGAVFLGVGAYNAGVTAGLAQNLAQTGGGVVVAPGYATAPYVGWGYGWGNGGFGFFGFFGTLLVIFLFFGLLRAAFGRGRGWGPGGPGRWGGHGGWDGRTGRDAWEDRVRQVHDDLHRTGTGPTTPGDPAQPKS
jgi:hypothetical protein